MEKLRVLIGIVPHEPSLRRLREDDRLDVQVVDPLLQPRAVARGLLEKQQVLLCSLPPENHSDLKQLRWVQIDSSGYSQLLPMNLPDCGVRATNAAGVFDAPIGEWNIAMMINLARDVRGMIRNQDRGVWNRDERFQMEVRGLTVGIWGYGGIGRHTARLAKALGMKVHVMTRSPVKPQPPRYHVAQTGDPEGVLPDRKFKMEEKEQFLKGIDFLVLAMPLTKATEGLIGEQELRALPPHAFVLNPARGPLIQEAALLRALREKWIAGAALDTHYHYPMPSDHPLWAMQNVIMTPHISGSDGSPHYLQRVWDIFTQNLQRFRAGEPLLNELTASQLGGA